jgi:glycosyltransferase involved in cell wall biosynthesis
VKILVDGVFFQIAQSGIARVWTEILRTWSQSDYKNNIILCDRSATAPEIDGITKIRIQRFDYSHVESDRFYLQGICDATSATAFISTYYTMPTRTPTALLVHDMIPEVLGWDLTAPMWAQKTHAIKCATRLIAVSRNTAHDLSRFHGTSRKIAVAYNGCSFTPPDASRILQFRRARGLLKPYFILSGRRGGYKNAALFFESFSRLGDSRDNYCIVCTGGEPIGETEVNAAGPAQIFRFELNDSDLAAAYAGAIALVYPSLYEGFGLPVLEAMSCGCPVITHNLASIPEVGGSAPLYIQPGFSSVDQLTRFLVDVQRTDIRFGMIERGLSQARNFGWDPLASTLIRELSEISTVGI